MKILIVTTAILFAISVSAQAPKKKSAMIKFMAGAITPKNGDPAFIGGVSAGPVLGDNFAPSFSIGYFKFKGGNAFFPIGIDFNFTDYNSKRLAPYVCLGAQYPIYQQNSSDAVQIKGLIHVKAGGGVAFPLKGLQKVIVAGYYSPIRTKITKPENQLGATTAESFIVSIEMLL